MKEVLKSLNKDEVVLLLLYYLKGLSIKEIANNISLNEEFIINTINKSLDNLNTDFNYCILKYGINTARSEYSIICRNNQIDSLPIDKNYMLALKSKGVLSINDLKDTDDFYMTYVLGIDSDIISKVKSVCESCGYI